MENNLIFQSRPQPDSPYSDKLALTPEMGIKKHSTEADYTKFNGMGSQTLVKSNSLKLAEDQIPSVDGTKEREASKFYHPTVEDEDDDNLDSHSFH